MGGCFSSPQPERTMVDTTSRGIGSNTSFVLRADGKLLVDGILWRFASLNAPELLDGDENGPFEVQDTVSNPPSLEVQRLIGHASSSGRSHSGSLDQLRGPILSGYGNHSSVWSEESHPFT